MARRVLVSMIAVVVLGMASGPPKASAQMPDRVIPYTGFLGLAEGAHVRFPVDRARLSYDLESYPWVLGLRAAWGLEGIGDLELSYETFEADLFAQSTTAPFDAPLDGEFGFGRSTVRTHWLGVELARMVPFAGPVGVGVSAGGGVAVFDPDRVRSVRGPIGGGSVPFPVEELDGSVDPFVRFGVGARIEVGGRFATRLDLRQRLQYCDQDRVAGAFLCNGEDILGHTALTAGLEIDL